MHIHVPLCLDISIRVCAVLAAFKAPCTTADGEPTNVYTLLNIEKKKIVYIYIYIDIEIHYFISFSPIS